MSNDYSPMKLLRILESEGVKLSVRGGKLYGSKFSTQGQRELVAANKDGLLAAVSHQCHHCNQPLRMKEEERYVYIECTANPLHYLEYIGKFPGKRMRVLTDFEAPLNCVECGQPNDNDMKHCDGCWLKAIEAE